MKTTLEMFKEYLAATVRRKEHEMCIAKAELDTVRKTLADLEDLESHQKRIEKNIDGNG